MKSLRCLLGRHESSIICGETLALCGCRDCGYVESWWPVLRPEASGAKQIVQAEAQARAANERAVIAEREERASRMGRRDFPVDVRAFRRTIHGTRGVASTSAPLTTS